MDFTKTLTLTALLLGATPLPALADGYLDRSGWEWYASSICANEQDITGLDGIHDGDPSTCWHSNYHAGNGTPERSNPHWVMIDRKDDKSQITALSYLPRTSGDGRTTCTQYAIYLSDSSLENTPADSYQSILDELGDPDYEGKLTGGVFDEQIIELTKGSLARYILFVNVNSNGSSSAACAEMNLIGPDGTGSAQNPVQPTADVNSILIATKGGQNHRIAIDGDNLSLSMSGTWLRLANSQLTVEYSMSEVTHFKAEKYAWPDNVAYEGTKTDVTGQPWPDDDQTNLISQINSELTLGLRNGHITATGAKPGELLRAIGLNGIEAARATADSNGVATIDTAGLHAGIYIVNISGVTLKITLK